MRSGRKYISFLQNNNNDTLIVNGVLVSSVTPVQSIMTIVESLPKNDFAIWHFSEHKSCYDENTLRIRI